MDYLGRRWVHVDIVVVPFVALREMAVHILDPVRLLWLECGPFHCLPVLDLGAAVFNGVGGSLRCGTADFMASTSKVMAGCLMSHVPRWNLQSAVALGPNATVALSSAEACSKCVCSHRCCSGVVWAVDVW